MDYNRVSYDDLSRLKKQLSNTILYTGETLKEHELKCQGCEYCQYFQNLEKDLDRAIKSGYPGQFFQIMAK